MRIEKRSIPVSARTGQGIDKLLALIDDELPRPSVEIERSCRTPMASWSPAPTPKAR